MLNIQDKKDCCGCFACAQGCPKHCITMLEDYEGFLYPKMDKTQCIDCGLCEKICHVLHPYEERMPQNVYAAINKDDEVRFRSSSGGLFYLFAEKIISEGGVVFGARFDEKWQVVLDYAETIEGVESFMGSKYVQARTATAYNDAEAFLKQGRKVLFSGTPCQIAGLHHYLRKEYDNLITVDFVCHGVPSPKVWQSYLDEVVSSVRNVSDVKFRNKNNGWKKFNFALSYNNGDKSTSLLCYHQQNHYMRAFLRNMILRPSCHACKAKSGRSHSDITIADFWGIERECPEMDDDKGTGLLLVNTGKGLALLDWSKMKIKKSDLDTALRYNSSLSHDTTPHPKREFFFASLDESGSVITLIDKLLAPPLKLRFRMLLGRYKRKILKNIRKYLIGGKTQYTNHIASTSVTSLASSNSIISICFRNKNFGWKTYCMEIRFR